MTDMCHDNEVFLEDCETPEDNALVLVVTACTKTVCDRDWMGPYHGSLQDEEHRGSQYSREGVFSL